MPYFETGDTSKLETYRSSLDSGAHSNERLVKTIQPNESRSRSEVNREVALFLNRVEAFFLNSDPEHRKNLRITRLFTFSRSYTPGVISDSYWVTIDHYLGHRLSREDTIEALAVLLTQFDNYFKGVANFPLGEITERLRYMSTLDDEEISDYVSNFSWEEPPKQIVNKLKALRQSTQERNTVNA